MNKTTVFLDCGDTLVDEGTQVHDPAGVVTAADLIPGAKETVIALKDRGYTVVLVADGLRQSFKNILTQHQLWDKFDRHVISEDVGYEKPHPAMFRTAAEAIGKKETEFSSIIMVGNNLARDIKGANALGIVSVFQSWSPRYPKTAADPSEIPRYRIDEPRDLLALLEELETPS